MNLEAQKKRLAVMLIGTGLCVFLALVAVVGSIRLHNEGLMMAFVGLMVAGFGVQIWFALGLLKQGRSE